MREIPLSGPQGRGLALLVDDEDYKLMSRFKWYAKKDRNGDIYPQVWLTPPRLLVPYALTDHVNGNKLDNTRANLREATSRQNSWNRRLRSDSKSGYKGVIWYKSRQQFRARIQVGDKRLCSSFYESAIEAARAYDALAREHFGEFARLNFPDSHDLPFRESLQARTRRRAQRVLSEMEEESGGAPSKYSAASWSRPPRKGMRSGFKGVYRSGKRWQGRIMKDGKRAFLGYFDTPEEAARAYDSAARALFGEHAWLNFPEEAA